MSAADNAILLRFIEMPPGMSPVNCQEMMRFNGVTLRL
jgi:hypothetical protein